MGQIKEAHDINENEKYGDKHSSPSIHVNLGSQTIVWMDIRVVGIGKEDLRKNRLDFYEWVPDQDEFDDINRGGHGDSNLNAEMRHY